MQLMFINDYVNVGIQVTVVKGRKHKTKYNMLKMTQNCVTLSDNG